MAEAYASQMEYLSKVLQLVQLRLAGDLYQDDFEKEITSRCQATLQAGRVLGLEYLFQLFRLTDFERHCVMLSLAGELAPQYSVLYAEQQRGNTLPTLGLCLQSFTIKKNQQMELLAAWKQRTDVLRYFFVDVSNENQQSQLQRGLKLHSSIVSFALDYDAKDPTLDQAGGIRYPEKLPAAMGLHQELLDRMQQFSAQHKGEKLLFCLTGAAGAGKKTLMQQYCAALERPLVWLNLPELLHRTESWVELLRPYLCETLLRHAVLAVCGAEKFTDAEAEQAGSASAQLRWLLDEASCMTDRLFFLSESNWRPSVPWGVWRQISLALKHPDASGRLHLWNTYTSALPLEQGISLDALANKFSLLPGQIEQAAKTAEQLRSWRGLPSITNALLHESCRAQLPSKISSMASRVNAAYTWDDLILPDMQKEKLKHACDQVEYRRKVYEEWGFGQKIAYGRGVSMLFSGPPGTGKTMAAQVIANRLQLELYKVDLSGVMSKYVGETEKQLGAVFDEVKKSQSILFFDEADALFGKRSEVKDAHDRYANIQTSYLLQKIEEYDGVVILASNLIQNFDEAFKRRIRFIIDFTLPDAARREKIWYSVLPQQMPISEDVDIEFLARSFELSGSSIKNIVVSAAFLAASAGVPVNMTHLLNAVKEEQHKAGKTMSKEDFGEYYRLVRLETARSGGTDY